MRRFIRRFPTIQLWLVALGIALGYLARLVLGSPGDSDLPRRAFNQPVVKPETEFDLPIIRSPPDSEETESF